jgi:nicotinate-nucleotide pyrophosphorylase
MMRVCRLQVTVLSGILGKNAATGVDYISIGALTHSAKASDFSLRVIDPTD